MAPPVRFLLACCLLLGPAPLVAQEKQVAEVTAVQTMGQLLAQPALTLSDGAQVRLGLETRVVPADSAVLVYALVHKTASTPIGHIGPLHMELRRLKAGERKP